MRWHANDPLEDFIRSSFLCDVRLPNIEQQSFIDSTSSLTYSHTCGEELAQDSRLLKQVYALLMLAHYQTTPQDLRLLLDHPKQKLYLCYQGGCLIALAWVSQEGALDADLTEQIALGKRRIQGHLLAQILTQQAGFPESCEMHSWRIQRIVVLPQLQNTGVGAALLNHVFALAQEANIDFLGTSFSASVDTLRFWLANQYIPAWLGLRADAATGLNSVQLIRPISINAHTLAGNLSHHLYGYLSFGKDFWFRSIDKKVLLTIATNCEKNTTPALDQMQKKRLLKLLALGQAGFSGGLYLLYQQLKDAKDKQEVLHAAHNNTHKGLQKSVRRLALSQVEPSYNQ
jgi:tRNA(Met) cytidine acetyltransferase